jgi:hypothetical protein
MDETGLLISVNTRLFLLHCVTEVYSATVYRASVRDSLWAFAEQLSYSLKLLVTCPQIPHTG